MKARFAQRLQTNAPIENLILAISMNNTRQRGEDFLKFIELVNRHNNPQLRINKITVLLSCWLQRHYIGDKGANIAGEEWLKENSENLKALTVPYEVIRWREFLNRKEYIDFYSKIVNVHNENEEFQTIINNLVKRHAPKADKESAQNYLFEECAVFCLLKDSYITYPSNELNAAVQFSIKYFKVNIEYRGYAFYSPKEVSTKQATPRVRKNSDGNSELLIKDKIKDISDKLGSLGYSTERQKLKFFRKALQEPKDQSDTQCNQPECSYK